MPWVLGVSVPGTPPRKRVRRGPRPRCDVISIDTSEFRGQRPRSLNPGWSSGRRPNGQWYFRSGSVMGRSLMDASRRRIRPLSSNSQFSLPYRAEPAAGVIVPFVGKAHGNAIPVEGPQLLDQPVVQLFRPLAPEKRDDLVPAVDELRTVSPVRLLRIRHGDFFRLTRVPGVFSEANLHNSRLASEWRYRRAPFGGSRLIEGVTRVSLEVCDRAFLFGHDIPPSMPWRGPSNSPS